MALSNSERQARWRAKRAAELKKLRRAAPKAPPEPDDQTAPETTDERPKRRRRKPLSNAERQAKWRAKRAAEVEVLRKAAAKAALAAHLAAPKRKRRPRYVAIKPPKRVRFSEYNLPAIDPGDRNAIRDHDLVRATLFDFEELADLPDNTREQLVEDLVVSTWWSRCGVNADKRGVANGALAPHVFLAEVGRASKRARLPVKRWRKKYDGSSGESFFFRLAREVADACGLTLPRDLKLAGQRAAQIQYDVMSPAMEAWQVAELAARGRQCLGDLVVRLKAAVDAELAARQQRLDGLAVRLEAAASKAQA